MLGAHVRAAEAAGDLGRERGARPAERDDGTSGPKSCVRAASATAWAILSTARSSRARAASSGVRFIRRGQRREGGERRGAGALGGLRRAVGRRARGGDRAVGGRGDVDEAERVRGARRGERVAAAVGRRDDGVLLGVAVARRDELELGAVEVARGRRSRRRAARRRARCAGRPPRSCGARARPSEPPAAPTTHESTERIDVGRPMTRSVRRTVRPPLTTLTFELVPPHSRTMPSVRESWCSAAATPAAGPEPIVNDGAARKASRLIAPPSPRRTSSGTSMPASRRTPSTTRAVRSTTGRIDAFTAAETVRVSRPYVPVSSWPAQTGRPRSRARAGDDALVLGRVDRERAADGERRAAGGLEAGRARRRSRVGSRPRVASRKACSVCRTRPGASLRSPTCVRLRARRSSGSTPMPITPTRATSPSSSAFIACVVEYATSSTRSRSSSRSSSSARSAGGDALGDPAGRGVARRHDRVRAQRQRLQGERDRLGEGAADVDADADAAAHGLRRRRLRDPPPARPAATRTRRSRRGCRSRACTPWMSRPCFVGWMPVSSARNTGRRGCATGVAAR